MKNKIKERYEGLQSVMLEAGNNACLFLSLLSIVEEVLKVEQDFYKTYKWALEHNFMREDFYMLDSRDFLETLIGKKTTFEKCKELPKKVPDKMYTIEKWYNKKTGYTHFKRRYFDTLKASVTVRDGKIQEYYCYTIG